MYHKTTCIRLETTVGPTNNELPNEQQRVNLGKLLTYMEGLPKGYQSFDMQQFCSGKLSPNEVVEDGCGTILCLAGHATVAGIGPDHKGGWPEYVAEYLCPRGRVFAWLFHSRWSETDNSLTGAIKRLRFFLNVGLPDNVEDIMYGEAPYPWDF